MPTVSRGLAILCIFTVACGGKTRDTGDTARARSRASNGSAIPAPELEAAARKVIAFLQGDVPFDSVALADTVTFYVTPDGGGNRRTFKGDALRSRSMWLVQSGKGTYSLVPPRGLTRMTTRVGRHFDCKDYSLSSRVPELKSFPHVGVKLEPDSSSSCLQVWNVTLVFEPSVRPPRLVAAVYDQWEW